MNTNMFALVISWLFTHICLHSYVYTYVNTHVYKHFRPLSRIRYLNGEHLCYKTYKLVPRNTKLPCHIICDISPSIFCQLLQHFQELSKHQEDVKDRSGFEHHLVNMWFLVTTLTINQDNQKQAGLSRATLEIYSRISYEFSL